MEDHLKHAAQAATLSDDELLLIGRTFGGAALTPAQQAMLDEIAYRGLADRLEAMDGDGAGKTEA